MHFNALLSLLSVIALLPSGQAVHHATRARSHKALAVRAAMNLEVRQSSGSGTRFSWYEPHVDAGACGTVHQDHELVVAMNVPQWAGGSHCYKSVTLRYKGKSVTAKVVDKCMGCPYGALDLSPGAFQLLGSIDAGYLWGGSWSFGNGGPSEEELAAQKAKEKAARDKAEKEAKEAAAREKAERERKQQEKEEKARAAAAAASSSLAVAAARSSEAAATRSSSIATSESAKPTNTSSSNTSEVTPAPDAEATGTQFIATANNAYVGLSGFLAAVALSH